MLPRNCWNNASNLVNIPRIKGLTKAHSNFLDTSSVSSWELQAKKNPVQPNPRLALTPNGQPSCQMPRRGNLTMVSPKQVADVPAQLVINSLQLRQKELKKRNETRSDMVAHCRAILSTTSRARVPLHKPGTGWLPCQHVRYAHTH